MRTSDLVSAEWRAAIRPETRALFAQPTHPYTRALLSAIPVLDPDAPRQRIELDPSSFNRDAPLQVVGDNHWAAI